MWHGCSPSQTVTHLWGKLIRNKQLNKSLKLRINNSLQPDFSFTDGTKCRVDECCWDILHICEPSNIHRWANNLHLSLTHFTTELMKQFCERLLINLRDDLSLSLLITPSLMRSSKHYVRHHTLHTYSTLSSTLHQFVLFVLLQSLSGTTYIGQF